MLLVLMSIFIACKDGNKTYKSGENFIKDDCSENCTCSHIIPLRRRRSTFGETGTFGRSRCIPLCGVRLFQTQCAVGFKVEEYRNPVNGTKCFCNESRCVKRK